MSSNTKVYEPHILTIETADTCFPTLDDRCMAPGGVADCLVTLLLLLLYYLLV